MFPPLKEDMKLIEIICMALHHRIPRALLLVLFLFANFSVIVFPILLKYFHFNQLDHILSPPPMPFRKCSNPDVASGPGKSLKFKKQLSEDGRQLRRGSLGGALTGRYLLPNPAAGPAWPASAETSNLVRMRSQALGQSAPSLTANLDLANPFTKL
ncbi:microtubule-associated serine/threonine-protein kinase 4 [Camelus ferus]|nr:microtubule-associated serine/threonine-protein kinase 4 [Camelus ferus]